MVALRRKTTRPDQSLTDWLLFRRSYYSERAALCTFFFGSVSWSLADRNVSFPLPKEGKRSSIVFRCLPTGMLDFQTLQEGHLNKYTKLSLRLKGSTMHIFFPGLLQIGMFHFHFLKRGNARHFLLAACRPDPSILKFYKKETFTNTQNCRSGTQI